MKKIFLIASVLIAGGLCVNGQTYMTRTGKIDFDATTKSSPEKIEAKNNEVACIVDAKTGDLRFQVLIKSFKFERELMQEHFNENYMESDKFPKSEFKGKITNLSEVKFDKSGTYDVKATGKLTIHGVTKDVDVTGFIIVKSNSLILHSKFSVNLSAYNISVPAVVADKVDKSAAITLEAVLEKN